MAKKNKKIEQSDLCTGCGVCVSVCPITKKLQKSDEFDPDTAKLAIRVLDGKAIVDKEICTACSLCVRNCPVESLSVVEIAVA